MDDLIGRNLGPYRIVEPLGLGGMSTVYKAHQPSMDRMVAIKVLPRHFAADPTFTGRFKQEARVIARLEHARILPVYDYGEADGIIYIVMRYLDSGTLADRLVEGPIPLDMAARVIGQVAEGLDYAHQQGVIHRDIKPSNILLDKTGAAYLTDFGISKLVEGTAQFTGTGIVGTPHYMSPEQGLGEPIDGRTDVYSLGVVLYQMVTGELPFKAETPMAVVIKHINEPLPLPSAINPDVPPAVEQVIVRAMAKSPDARYQSAGALAAGLREAVAAPGQAASGPRPAAPAAIKTGQETGTLRSPAPIAEPTGVVDATGQKEAPKKKRGGFRRFLLIVGIIFAVLICAFLALSILSNIGERRDAAQATPEATPEQQAEQPGEPTATPAPRPEGFNCPPGAREVRYEDFQKLTLADLDTEGLSLVDVGDGDQVLVFTPLPDSPVFTGVQERVADSLVRVLVSFPEGPGRLLIASRVGADGAETGYAGLVSSEGNGILRVVPGAEPFSFPGRETPALFDGAKHLVELTTKGDTLVLAVDGQVIAEWLDPEALPAGALGFEVGTAPAWLHYMLICDFEGSEARGPLFVDEFEEGLNPQWEWLRMPDYAEVVDGQLVMSIDPGTGDFTLRQGLDLPAVTVGLPDMERFSLQVDLTVAPGEDRQFAGLMLLTEAGRPVVSVSRGFCSAVECAGDAIYFKAHALLPGADERAPAETAGGGTLPAGPVRLLLVYERTLVRAYYSTNQGAVWTLAGEANLPDALEVRQGLRAGLFTATQGTRPSGAIRASFDSFLETASAPGNLP